MPFLQESSVSPFGCPFHSISGSEGCWLPCLMSCFLWQATFLHWASQLWLNQASIGLIWPSTGCCIVWLYRKGVAPWGWWAQVHDYQSMETQQLHLLRSWMQPSLIGLPEDWIGSDIGWNPQMKWALQSPSVSGGWQSLDHPGFSRMRILSTIYSIILEFKWTSYICSSQIWAMHDIASE